ncbi:hypothetical protein BOX15_Mlig015795g1 [Macrostomum lignano]|uniref:B box-type domain-containing protein n=1 Tax=Macrostomum lignano TaxID=282301 RepID=A0A267FZT7_9PLAT|nr:hypothetical protein BOX15_Mlig015795g1 [Macrostomum lignano]
MSDDMAHAVEDLLEDREVSLLMMMNNGSASGNDSGSGLGIPGDDLRSAGDALENAGECLLGGNGGEEEEDDQNLLRETFGSDADDDINGSGLNGSGDGGRAGSSACGSGGGGGGNGADAIIGGANSECSLCQRQLTEPVILACLHRFDLPCLEAAQAAAAGGFLLFCPRCQTPTVLNPEAGLAGLTRDHLYLQELQGSHLAEVKCGGCTTGAEAVAKCRECADYLCSTCRQAHSVMKMFSRHHVKDLEQPGSDPEADSGLLHKPIYCQEHPADQLKYYCRDCGSLHCPECVATGHKLHNIDQATTAGAELQTLLSQDARSLRDSRRRWDREQDKLQERLSEIADSRQHNEGAIKEALASYRAFLDEAGKRFLEENRRVHSELEMRAMELMEHTAKGAEQMAEAASFVQAYTDRAGPVVLAYAAKVLHDWSATLLRAHWDTDLPTSVPFTANHPSFKAIVMANFGTFGSDRAQINSGTVTAASAAAPVTTTTAGDLQATSIVASVAGSVGAADVEGAVAVSEPALDAAHASSNPSVAAVAAAAAAYSNPALFGLPPPTQSQPSPGAPGSDSGLSNGSDALLSSMLAAKLQLVTDPAALSTAAAAAAAAAIGRTGTPTGSLDFGAATGGGVITGGGAPGSLGSPLQSSASGGGGSSSYPNRMGRCSSMTVRHRWGSLGSSRGQFNSPHGFCLGVDEEIVVADTQNHRVQVFEKSGEHKFQFGVPGREEGQLWYPRKVVVARQTGKFIVCDRGSERSRMQIFSRSGNFLRKITIRYIDIVAGLAINSKQHIVAVDSVSPTVFVIAEAGDLVKWFDCSSYMREPSDIAIHGNEYFICDFKGHCVCVFQEDGVYLRRIGSEAITNFPNGIDISDHGDVLVGDSHGNKFHVAVFNRLGQLTSEFECPTVKVSRCCGLKITGEGYVVTLAKNNHHVLVLNTLYIS